MVSVIIPNYNHAKYLDKRIQSVLNQTFQNFEVIILDDKSTDNSCRIIEKYHSNPKVSHIIFNEENSGSTFIQWNKGFELAKGDLIWIAESDDYCEPDFLALCVCEFESNPNAGVVYVGSEYVDSEENDLGTFNPYTESKYYYKGIDFIRKRLDVGCAIWNASAVVFKKELALSISQDYQNFKACGDKLFWIYMAEKGDVIYINKIINYFRQHDNKVSPRRFRDGTSLREEKRIFDYQVQKGYLTGLRKYNSWNLHAQKVMTGVFDNENIRETLKRIWGIENINKRKIISFLSRLFQYKELYLKKEV